MLITQVWNIFYEGCTEIDTDADSDTSIRYRYQYRGLSDLLVLEKRVLTPGYRQSLYLYVYDNFV